MFTREMFIDAMEKKAAEDCVDNHAAALKQHDSNRTDAREQLGSLFSHAGSTGKADTGLVNKLFPGKGSDKESSHPLLKVAQDPVVSEVLSRFPTGEDPHYNQVLMLGFRDELEKTAVMMPGQLAKILSSMPKAKPAASSVGQTAQSYLNSLKRPAAKTMASSVRGTPIR